MNVITHITRVSLFKLTKLFIVLYNITHPFILQATEQQEEYTNIRFHFMLLQGFIDVANSAYHMI